MARFTFALALLVLPISGCSCGDSHDADTDAGPDDAGITFDAPPPVDAPGIDTGGGDIDTGMMMTRDGGPPGVCGNGDLEAGEGCDDGNTTDGDGCDAMCRREAFCGDGDVDAGEVCDDGNNASGDGCRSDCQSDESCGNAIRDIAAGEICDDGNRMSGDGCSADCLSLEGCGNGMMDMGETCDDGNTTPWDGCGADCLVEVSVVVDDLSVGDPDEGCDFSGDGMADNRFSEALGDGRGFFNGQVRDGIRMGDVILLAAFLGLEDQTGSDDDSLRTAFLNGIDADMMPGNNLGGMGTFYVDMAALGAGGLPTAAMESTLMAHVLAGGPEDITIWLPLMGAALPIDLKQARVSGTTRAMGGRLANVDDGLLCGAIPIGTLALAPNPLDMLPFGAPTEACDGTMDIGSLADLLVGGASILGMDIGPASPDVDLDGDGLETFVVDDMGAGGCQAVIVSCIDGDGTVIDGRGCALDGRIADGFSAGLPFTAVGARILGTM